MTPAPAPLIALRGLSMHYAMGAARIDVLRAVDLDIAAGQTVAVTGPSGSGKTSLLLLLAGLEQPAAGSVSLAGTALGTLGRDALADLRRDRIGIVFQSFHLLPSLSALDNVALPLQIAGQREALPRARELLGRVGLAERLHHYPSQLSGGEQQRVAIARALVHRPQLLLADEPTGNLDDHTGARVRELLFELQRETGATLVLVTHDPSFAARCDRVLQLHDGRLLERSTPAPEKHAVPA
jgi:putative ABC transport system ATP-binding protein